MNAWVDEARLALEHCGEMLEQPSRLSRVSLPVDFATTVPAPQMAKFWRWYPDISFDFDLEPRRVDLLSDPFDVAIRWAQSAIQA